MDGTERVDAGIAPCATSHVVAMASGSALHCTALHCTALRWQVDGNAERPLKFSQVSVPHCAKQRGMRLLKADVCVLSQVFQLCPFPNNAGYWVLNDMFRLNIG